MIDAISKSFVNYVNAPEATWWIRPCSTCIASLQSGLCKIHVEFPCYWPWERTSQEGMVAWSFLSSTTITRGVFATQICPSCPWDFFTMMSQSWFTTFQNVLSCWHCLPSEFCCEKYIFMGLSTASRSTDRAWMGLVWLCWFSRATAAEIHHSWKEGLAPKRPQLRCWGWTRLNSSMVGFRERDATVQTDQQLVSR